MFDAGLREKRVRVKKCEDGRRAAFLLVKKYFFLLNPLAILKFACYNEFKI